MTEGGWERSSFLSIVNLTDEEDELECSNVPSITLVLESMRFKNAKRGRIESIGEKIDSLAKF